MKAYRYLESLIYTIGARPATSEAEAWARAMIERRLHERGIKTITQPFRSVPSFTTPWVVVSLGFVLAGVSALASLWGVAAALSIIASALYWGLVSGKWDVMRLFPQRESANLIAIVPPRETVRRRVVVMAHIDSTRAALLWDPKTVRYFGLSFQLQTLLLGLLTLGTLLGLAGYAAVGQILALPGTLLSLWGLFVLAHREWRMPWVQGANDNGSGVAVLGALLERLAAVPLRHTEVWGVFTGCEEVGTPAGAFAFEREYGAQLRDAEFLIVDHVGLGAPRYLLAEGMLPRQHAHPEMVQRFAQLATRHPEWELKPSAVPHGAYTDALPFLIKRYRAIAMWCETQPGIPPNWHWVSDVIENVSPDDLERASHVVEAYLREYD
jgi:hypothetical protein